MLDLRSWEGHRTSRRAHDAKLVAGGDGGDAGDLGAARGVLAVGESRQSLSGTRTQFGAMHWKFGWQSVSALHEVLQPPEPHAKPFGHEPPATDVQPSKKRSGQRPVGGHSA